MVMRFHDSSFSGSKNHDGSCIVFGCLQYPKLTIFGSEKPRTKLAV